ncbi:MAG TPA: DUF4294 domain-containing protein [Ferruginibacter sp.]|nr:DUF4294 domain-containing protein [Ferruginibacter sp.]
MLKHVSHIRICTLLLLFILASKSNAVQAQQLGINDTITVEAIVYNGDTIESKVLDYVFLYCKYPPGKSSPYAQYNRLRNAVYVCYPYAIKAGAVLNDINAHLVNVTNKAERRKYIKSREKELKKEFSDPLTNLSIYQGKVLMKLINRESGNNCYEIIKEYKGGLTARFYQTVAFFFSSNLKQPYDASGEDIQIERFVQEVCRSYGYTYVPGGPIKQM